MLYKYVRVSNDYTQVNPVHPARVHQCSPTYKSPSTQFQHSISKDFANGTSIRNNYIILKMMVVVQWQRMKETIMPTHCCFHLRGLGTMFDGTVMLLFKWCDILMNLKGSKNHLASVSSQLSN